jgi:hypothetical protein
LSTVSHSNAFWKWEFGNGDEGVYTAIGFDRLHVLKGLIVNVINALDWVLGEESEKLNVRGRTAYIDAKKAFMDSRFAQIPPYFGGHDVYVPRLTSGFYSKQRVEAWQYSVWLSVISFVICDDDSVIKSGVKRAQFLNNVSLLLPIVHTIWQRHAVSVSLLNELNIAIEGWRSHFLTHFVLSSPSRCCFDNFHKLTHAGADAVRNGGWSVTCTSSWERAHTIFAKVPAQHHNRKGVPEVRMLRWVRDSDYLCKSRQALGTNSDRNSDATTSTASGSITRVQGGIFLYQYFRLRNVVFPTIATRVLLRELRRAAADDTLILKEVEYWQFLRFRTVGAAVEHVVRSPKALSITCIQCGEFSFGQVLAIANVRETTFLVVRWYTPSFPGSNKRPSLQYVVSTKFLRLKLTNAVVVIPLDHVQKVVHIVPDFRATEFFFVNTTPLGTTLRARPWEDQLALSTH